MIQKTFIASAISLVLLSACSDDNTPSGTDNTNGSSNGDTNPSPQSAERNLQMLENSDAFFTALREGLVRQNPNGAVGSPASEGDFINSPQVVDAAAEGGTTDGTGSDAGVGAIQTDGVADTTATQSNESAVGSSDVTGTNVQEIGVDEQDRMKSDGEFLYIIENQYADYWLDTGIDSTQVDSVETSVDVEPPEQVPVAEVTTNSDEVDFAIELLPVTPVGVESTSPVSPQPQQNITNIRILALENDVPDAVPVTVLKLNLNGATADGIYLFKDGTQRNLILTGTSFNNYLYDWDYSYAFNNASSLVSKMDVTNPTQASVSLSVKIDGQIISSRRIDDKLFVASRYYPSIANIDPYSMTPEAYEAAIEAADLSQSLPKITAADGTITELVNPAECFVATKGHSDDYYYTPDIISLAVIDLKTFQLEDSECFLGSSEALYATPNSVYLATTRWDYRDQPSIEPTDDGANADSDVASFVLDPRVDTDIHQFAINGSELTYSGSGVVSGHLGWNPTRKPFRMSEKDGHLRVATFSEAQNESVSPIRLSVLNVVGDGELVKVSELPNANNPEHIGKPGEQLYASRFLGDRAYLVTFRQTDPLYVVDMSNPADPKLAGELEIDGYSDYLQPIGDNHLLGIGRDAVPGPVGWEDGALIQGVKLSLFNVSDPSNPTEVQSVVVGERGTEAAALQNHRAITIQAATDSHPTRVAFGIDVHGLANPRPSTNDPSVWFPWNFSGLHGFDINVGSGAGIELRGVMKVNSASNPRPSAFDFYGNDRAVIVGDSVYYIRDSGVFAATWTDLGNFTGPR